MYKQILISIDDQIPLVNMDEKCLAQLITLQLVLVLRFLWLRTMELPAQARTSSVQ